MKQETEKRIVKLIQQLTGREEWSHVVQELQEALVCEANDVKLGKLDLYKFTAKDKLRPALTGVYYSGGWQVATDGYILIACKQDYAEEKEGQVILKDGTVIEDKYPNWRSVIPAMNDEWKTFRLNTDELSAAMRKIKVHTKVYGKYSCMLSIDDKVWLDPNFFKLFATAMKEAGTDTLRYHSDSRGIVVITDTMQLLLMPKWPPTEEHLADESRLYITLHSMNQE